MKTKPNCVWKWCRDRRMAHAGALSGPGRRPLVLVPLLAAALPFVVACGGGGGPAAAATATARALAGAGGASPTVTATVSTSVERVVTADGALALPLDPQRLAFTASGTVSEVMAEAGDAVGAGQPLARIDGAPLALSVAEARASLTSAQAALVKLEAGDSVATARLELERAKNNLWANQSQRDATCGLAEEKDPITRRPLASGTACDQAQAGVQASEQTVQIAQKHLEATEAGAPSDLIAAQARVASARLALSQAQTRQGEAVLTAPFSGTIVSVLIAKGVQVSPGTPVMTLAQTEPLRFVTTNLSERNVGEVSAGAPSTVTLTAFSDHPFAARVARIADEAKVDETGAVVFAVYLDVDSEGLPIKAGMTGRVEIRVSER